MSDTTTPIQGLTNNVRDKLLRRDSAVPAIPDGNYHADVIAVGFNTRPDKYNPGAERDVMTVTFETKATGKPERLYYEVGVSLHEKSKMYALLSKLDKLPALNAHFAPAVLVGVQAVVQVKNNAVADKVYPNIVDVFPAIQVPAVPTSSVTNLTTAEIDEIFADTDDGEDEDDKLPF